MSRSETVLGRDPSGELLETPWSTLTGQGTRVQRSSDTRLSPHSLLSDLNPPSPTLPPPFPNTSSPDLRDPQVTVSTFGVGGLDGDGRSVRVGRTSGVRVPDPPPLRPPLETLSHCVNALW